MSFITVINHFFEWINGVLVKFFFYDLLFFSESHKFPFVVFLLFASAVFFTFRMGFVNFRFFWRAVEIVSGKHDRGMTKAGEISHFKALATALSATVGLGNIAGVAVAISVGGPGATFWMIVCGLLGMSTKFTECTLGVMFRKRRADGHIMGGPMIYIKEGLAQKGLGKLGIFLAGFFCVICIGGSFGGGTAFQVNQSLNAIAMTIPALENHTWIYGIVMAFLVGLVIIGGLKRIAQVTSKVVPFMCAVYILMCLFILVTHSTEIPSAIAAIFKGAFTPAAGFGGFLGVLVTGFQRGSFSNEAGLGSAVIAHSAAQVKHPVEEGLVALLEPFIDTVLICTMTALVIILTGAHINPEYTDLITNQKGAALTSHALREGVSWFPYILSLSVFLFAFSTIISWSYYGERCFSFLFGEKRSLIYKLLVLAMVFMGAVASSTNIMQFGDLMILGMAFPNLIGVLLLSGKVKESLKDYIQKFS